MKAKLKVATGKLAGKTVRLKQGTILIGRSQECYLRARSDTVSRRHCEITVGDSSVTVQDLQSKNGTLVNGARIEGPLELKTGDQLQVGPMRFEVLIALRPETGPSETPVAEVEAEIDETTETGVQPAPLPASERTGDYEEDISAWLDDEQESMATARPAGAQDTNVPETDETRPVSPADVRTENQRSKDEGKRPAGWPGGKKKRDVGKLPQSNQAATQDSGEAAANLLKGFSRQK